MARSKGCGKVETLQHLLDRHGLCMPDQETAVGKWQQFLCRMAERISGSNLPIPRPLETEAERMEIDEIPLLEETESLNFSEDSNGTRMGFDYAK